MSTEDSSSTALRSGLSAYRAGEFFVAHERFEDGWRAATGHDRELLHGLTQLAVARLHAARGNRKGAKTLLARARAHLARAGTAARGLDVAALLAEAREVVER